jgi:PAS domain S-box-containing protein
MTSIQNYCACPGTGCDDPPVLDHFPRHLQHRHPITADALIDTMTDGVFSIDLDWRITSFNRVCERLTGVPREQAIGRPCSEVLRFSTCHANCPLRYTLETEESVIATAGFLRIADGDDIPVNISTTVIRDDNHRVIGGVNAFRPLPGPSVTRTISAEIQRVHGLSSRSVAMHRLFRMLPRAAAGDSTVLLYGETGTGKELIARAVHDLSPRADQPFVAVNCAALPDTLLESELFGYRKGAFTGACEDKPGRFNRAEGGTIFLDEIGDISPALQARLLRVLQEWTYEPLGSTRTETADVRVIAATNRILRDEVDCGRFRKDLYYRLNVAPLEIPPLRERAVDIPMLATEILDRRKKRRNSPVEGFSPAVLSYFMAYDWPGNVRELENVIERCLIYCEDRHINVEHLPDEISGATARTICKAEDLRSSHDLLDTCTITEALTRNNYNRLETARELGIHKTTLFRRMRRLGISAR